MTKILLVNWHIQPRKTSWWNHKSTNFCMELCWPMPKLPFWPQRSIYFDYYLPLNLSIGKLGKQSWTACEFSWTTFIFVDIRRLLLGLKMNNVLRWVNQSSSKISNEVIVVRKWKEIGYLNIFSWFYWRQRCIVAMFLVASVRERQ